MRRIIFAFYLFLSFTLSSQTTDWVRSFGGPDSDKGISIGVDSLGFIYCSGFFNNEATFGGITLTNSGFLGGNNKEMFVFKMDSLGNVLWAIAGGDLSGSCCDDRALGMHVTPGGDVFITGTFWSSYNLGLLSVPAAQMNLHDNSLLAKIDKDGNPVWIKSFGSDDQCGNPCNYPITDADDHSYDVKVDADGFIYITGFFSGCSADFDNFDGSPPLTITNLDWGVDCQPMGYIGKLDPNGDWLWVDKFDGIKDQRGSRDNRLAIDQFSNIYVVGGFQGTANYGPYSINSNGEWDAFIFKMDKDGNWLWAEGIGSNKTDRANGIAIDVCDDIYITGEYRNPMVFAGANASNGTDTLSHKQKRDIFVAKMNNQGEWKWAKRARSAGTDKPYQMSVDVNKQVFLGGTMKDTATFNENIVVPPQIVGDTSASAWVAQLDGSTNTGDWVWAKMAGTDTDDDDRTGDICADGFGNVYAIGFYEDVADFDGTILNSLGRKDIFVWKMNMTPGSFTYNNTYDTIYAVDSMVFNPVDTGFFTISSLEIDGCDTAFVDTIVHRRLGIQIDYSINNPGTAIINIDGVTQNMPFSQQYWVGDMITINAVMQPNWIFKQWRTYSNTVLPSNNTINASFIASYSDSCVLITDVKPPLESFISNHNGSGDTICPNREAEISVSFSGGTEPYTFVYAINGVDQSSITTTINPYIINSSIEGLYTLTSFFDANETGSISGSASVNIAPGPEAIFSSLTDTLNVIYPRLQLNDMSNGNIVKWDWNFGDNTPNQFVQNPYHTYEDTIGIYQISLVVTNNFGCVDTAIKYIWITDEYWMYIPNAFTPDNDGVNDLFCIQYNGIREKTFNFNIYDRFADLVYSTDKIDKLECFLNSNGWDGTHYRTGNELPMGTYIYEVYFQDFEGWKHQEKGHLLIVR